MTSVHHRVVPPEAVKTPSGVILRPPTYGEAGSPVAVRRGSTSKGSALPKGWMRQLVMKPHSRPQRSLVGDAENFKGPNVSS